jgi:hypothetical protein
MATRDEFLKQVWNDNINSYMAGHWIDGVIKSAEKNPDEPFADLGSVLKRLQSVGATKEELSSIACFAAYEASFGLLYMFGDPGVDEGEADMMHESLLSADPSGKEGRPGSWPIKK